VNLISNVGGENERNKDSWIKKAERDEAKARSVLKKKTRVGKESASRLYREAGVSYGLAADFSEAGGDYEGAKELLRDGVDAFENCEKYAKAANMEDLERFGNEKVGKLEARIERIERRRRDGSRSGRWLR